MSNGIGWLPIYAAAVATMALGWKIYDIIRDRLYIKVEVSFAEVIGYGLDAGNQNVAVRAMNRGRRPVTISGAGFRLSNRRELVYNPAYDHPLHELSKMPKRLNEGEQHSILFDVLELRKGLNKTPYAVMKFAWVRDETGRLYKGKVPKYIKKLLA